MNLNPLRRRAVRTAISWKRLQNGSAGARDAEHVLADLRDFTFSAPHATSFHKDPIEMARRTGRREVFERIRDFLNLDENAVQQLMEVDDGL